MSTKQTAAITQDSATRNQEPQWPTMMLPRIATSTAAIGVTNTRSNPGTMIRPVAILPHTLNGGTTVPEYRTRRNIAASTANNRISGERGSELRRADAQNIHQPTSALIQKPLERRTGSLTSFGVSATKGQPTLKDFPFAGLVTPSTWISLCKIDSPPVPLLRA